MELGGEAEGKTPTTYASRDRLAGPMPTNLDERLIDAACAGNTEAVRRLVAAGANPNYQTDSVNTVLMWATTHGHLDAARALLDAGAEVNAQDRLGGTALIVAAANGDLAMVAMLLQAGAEPHVADHDGNTAAAWASHVNTPRVQR